MPRERPPSSSSSGAAADRGNDYIEHRVSKLDTLAGVAIKYGVEVADIKRANGLGTDLHMFGHQTLRIPFCGRHGEHAPSRRAERQETSRLEKKYAPSPIILPGAAPSPESHCRENKTFSSAMNLLRGYYGLSSPAQHSSCTAEGMELTSYRSEGEDYSEDEPMSPLTPPSTLRSHLSNGKASANASTGKVMSRLSNEYTPESASVPSFGVGDGDRSSEPSVRRRSKVDGMGPLSGPSEIEIKQDTDPPDKVLQTSYALPIGTDSIGGRTAGFLKVFDAALVGGKTKDEPFSKVTKSMSASNLQDQTSLQASSSGVKYSTKLDAKSASQIQPSSRSLFEGLSKPAIPRYKEALD